MARAYLELFAGGAACALALMGGPRVVPPVGYMGGKRKLAPSILGTVGLRPGQGADRVLLVDAGEWGGVWSEVVRDGRGLADRLLGWEGRDPSDLWRELAAAGRPEDPQERAAAYLWLQGRAASCTPVWWEGSGMRMTHRNGVGGPCEQHQPRLIMPEKGNRGVPVKDAVERSTRKASTSRHASSGVTRPATVAARILRASASLAGARVDRRHPSAAEVAAWLGTPGDLSDVVVMLDPPYVGATRYEATCTRDQVVSLAEDYRRLGASVVVCEAEALPELLALGWHALDLREASTTEGKPEWLTCSDPPQRVAVPRQLKLWSVA